MMRLRFVKHLRRLQKGPLVMLFVNVMKPRPGSNVRARIARRVDWKYPQGIKVIAEYWLPADDPQVISIVECDNVSLVMDAVSEWDTEMESNVYPAVTAEQGIAHAREVLRAAA